MKSAGRSFTDYGDVLDEVEAAELIGVCDRTLREYRKRKQVPFARMGGRVLYIKAQLIAWLHAGGTAQFEGNN